MPIASAEITDLLAKPPSQVTAGKATALARRAGRGSKAEAFLTDYADGARAMPPPQVYAHPADPPRTPRKDGPLSPVELAWIQRQFPPGFDPADVPLGDAKALAAMGATVPASQHPADARMVDAIWGPVKAHHDAGQAKVTIANASRPTPPIPSSALPALAESVAAEHPELQPAEALGRAHGLVRDAAGKREQSRQDTIAKHEAVLAGAAGFRPWNRPATPSAGHAGAWGSPAVAP